MSLEAATLLDEPVEVGPAPARSIPRLPAQDLTPTYQPSSYAAPRMRAPTVAVVAAGHVALLALLAGIGAVTIVEPEKKPLVVRVIELPLDPPKAAAVPDHPVEVKPVEVQFVAPKPLVTLPPAPVVIPTVSEPPPAPAVVVPPAPAPMAGPVEASDLSSSMVSATPPKYPIESRKKREQGTVVLSVLVGTSGGVEQVSIAKSSGFSRLDKAALDAVRRWRWSPTVRGGQPVMVKGYVDIPFVLT